MDERIIELAGQCIMFGAADMEVPKLEIVWRAAPESRREECRQMARKIFARGAMWDEVAAALPREAAKRDCPVSPELARQLRRSLGLDENRER